MHYLIAWIVFALSIPGYAVAATIDWKTAELMLDKQLAASAQRIEIVSVNGKLSHLEYSQQVRQQESEPISFPELHLSDLSLRPFGTDSTFQKDCIQKKGTGVAGFLLDLRHSSDFLNILPYQTAVMDAVIEGRWRVALADERLALLEDNATLGFLEDTEGRQSLSLSALPASFDRSRAAYLVFLLESKAGSLTLNTASFTRIGQETAAKKSHAAWFWNSQQLVDNESTLLSFLKKKQIDRLYLQIHDQLTKFQPFLKAANVQGVDVYALDGASDTHLHSNALFQRIQSVIQYNRKNPDASFSGFQLDVEPYLQKDFAVMRERHIAAYLEMLDRAKKVAGNQLKLSVVIPFWFSQIATSERDLGQEVLKRADEVVVMAYRRNYEQVLQISLPMLAAGEWAGKPVRLGVELTPLVDEEHLVLVASKQGESDSIMLGGKSWKISGSYTVQGDTLSWSGAIDQVATFLLHNPPLHSFAGWVLHSLDVMGWDK